ncbi:hypothetical protein BDZ94DRAFT_1301503 [Collybia nuda]|uniref:Uncharacterized protein n=1 Tax=Collybia nuda TaxID=64659 RepID=A0A9P5XUI5_9AGAR|nr:hypothetical protein BDZ94DRAFT_1301503 [Collybia nuda]
MAMPILAKPLLILPRSHSDFPDLRFNECFIEKYLYQDPQAPENVLTILRRRGPYNIEDTISQSAGKQRVNGTPAFSMNFEDRIGAAIPPICITEAHPAENSVKCKCSGDPSGELKSKAKNLGYWHVKPGRFRRSSYRILCRRGAAAFLVVMEDRKPSTSTITKGTKALELVRRDLCQDVRWLAPLGVTNLTSTSKLGNLGPAL